MSCELGSRGILSRALHSPSSSHLSSKMTTEQHFFSRLHRTTDCAKVQFPGPLMLEHLATAWVQCEPARTVAWLDSAQHQGARLVVLWSPMCQLRSRRTEQFRIAAVAEKDLSGSARRGLNRTGSCPKPVLSEGYFTRPTESLRIF